MPWTISSSQAILFKAGANFNSTAGTSGALLELISKFAEGSLVRDTEYDWVSNASSISATFLDVLKDATSDVGAKFLIEHDMSGYTQNGEAVTMVNILIDNYTKNVARLKDKNVQALARGGV